MNVFSQLIAYFNLQNTKISTDTLTSLNNRRKFEIYIENKLRVQRSFPILFALMIDIDRLKYINDQYGHIAGDDAIKKIANILLRSVAWNDFIARIGGDEFVIIGERESEKSVFDTVTSIRNEIAHENDSLSVPYTLSISIGYAFLREGEMKSVEDLVREADKIMYQEKSLNRQR